MVRFVKRKHTDHILPSVRLNPARKQSKATYNTFYGGVVDTTGIWIDGKPTQCMKAWRKLMMDVHNGDVTVCDEWKSLKCFVEWWDGQHKCDGMDFMHLIVDDDDSSIPHYSPTTCFVVPFQVKRFFNVKYNDNGLPKGVIAYYDCWRVIVPTINPKVKKTNRCNSKEKALKCFVKFKKLHGKQLIEKYQGKIDQRIINRIESFEIILPD